MANLFKNLPHLLGTITNLDGAQSMRALASINAGCRIGWFLTFLNQSSLRSNHEVHGLFHAD